MSSDLDYYRGSGLTKRQARSLAITEGATAMRVADARADALVATARMQEIDRLARNAAAGQAMLHQWASTLAAGDVFVADELAHFVKLARLGKSEILVGVMDDFARRSR